MTVKKLKRTKDIVPAVVEGEVEEDSVFVKAFCEAPEDMPLKEQLRFYDARMDETDDGEQYIAYMAAAGHVRFLLSQALKNINERFPAARSGIDQMIDEATGRNTARHEELKKLGFTDEELASVGL